MKRTHLPLNALRVFDAAARHLSFTRAADELAVTPAAVGQQIRALEDMLGVVLFRRTGWSPADYSRWADKLLEDQVAFMPPTVWEGETVARFAFLHPHTPMELVREILDRMAVAE